MAGSKNKIELSWYSDYGIQVIPSNRAWEEFFDVDGNLVTRLIHYTYAFMTTKEIYEDFFMEYSTRGIRFLEQIEKHAIISGVYSPIYKSVDQQIPWIPKEIAALLLKEDPMLDAICSKIVTPPDKNQVFVIADRSGGWQVGQANWEADTYSFYRRFSSGFVQRGVCRSESIGK